MRNKKFILINPFVRILRVSIIVNILIKKGILLKFLCASFEISVDKSELDTPVKVVRSHRGLVKLPLVSFHILYIFDSFLG